MVRVSLMGGVLSVIAESRDGERDKASRRDGDSFLDRGAGNAAADGSNLDGLV